MRWEFLGGGVREKGIDGGVGGLCGEESVEAVEGFDCLRKLRGVGGLCGEFVELSCAKPRCGNFRTGMGVAGLCGEFIELVCANARRSIEWRRVKSCAEKPIKI